MGKSMENPGHRFSQENRSIDATEACLTQSPCPGREKRLEEMDHSTISIGSFPMGPPWISVMSVYW